MLGSAFRSVGCQSCHANLEDKLVVDVPLTSDAIKPLLELVYLGR